MTTHRFLHHLLVIVLTLSCVVAQARERRIKRVQAVEVMCPQGTAPRLPHVVWTTYADGKAEWRQVRWSNSAKETEQEEARVAAGKSYEVKGFVTGDASTTQGYEVKAKVKVTAARYDVPTTIAHPLPLGDVRLTGNNRLTHNRDLATRELLSWDVKQQLYNYRDTYGLPTDGYPVADGWDSPTTKLKGHGTGHYLSALALAYASNTDATIKNELKSRMQCMVDEMRMCQERTFVWSDSLGRYFEARDVAPADDLKALRGSWADFDRYKRDWQHYGHGYLNAISPQHALMVEMYRPYNNEQWVWAPYYTIHKQLAGLIDIATLVDDKTIADKALLIAHDMGMWVWNRMHHRTFADSTAGRNRPGNRHEMWNIYIAGENGGMGESMARLATMASDDDARDKFVEAARAFDNPSFFDALAHNIDDIRTRHANQHIPQIVGALAIATARPSLCDECDYYNLSLNFWQMVQGRYRYATGGVGNGEMFRLPYTQMLSMVTNGVSALDSVANPTLNETCCAYNLAKLTRDLNCYTPNDARLMDYYERVLYNQIVGSLNPDEYATTYHYAVGLNASKPWGNRTPQESCCGGTGSENHVKYQEAAYYVGGDTLWVALYLPTEAVWRDKNVRLTQTCDWPAERSTITIATGGRFAMKLRRPYWADSRFAVMLNGKPIATVTSPQQQPAGYVTIAMRQWQAGDVVQIEMPYTLHLDFAPDKVENQRATNGTLLDPAWAAAVMHGPLVMTGTGATNWQQATISTDTRLKGIDLAHFKPDYDRHTASTHYYRMAFTDVQPHTSSADLSRLQSAVKTSAARLAQPDAWAPHGYARMKEQHAAATTLLAQKKPHANDVERIAAALEAAIVAMRPSNLAEPEDLAPLLALMRQAEAHNKTRELTDALKNARMVTRYVCDGSGTHDMIAKAEQLLREAM